MAVEMHNMNTEKHINFITEMNDRVVNNMITQITKAKCRLQIFIIENLYFNAQLYSLRAI